MVEFRIILLKTKFQPTLFSTPVYPVAFPIFAFTFTTEQKKIPKFLTYDGVKKELQLWYF